MFLNGAKVDSICTLYYVIMITRYILFRLRKLTILLVWLSFRALFKGLLCSGKHPLSVPCPHRIRYISVSDNFCFRICFRGFCIRFRFHKQIWKQMWHHPVPSVSAPFSSLVVLENFVIQKDQKKHKWWGSRKAKS